MTYQESLKLKTRGHGHMQDLTGTISKIVAQSGIKTGIVQIFNVGSTASIGIIEFEPGLEGDLPAVLDKLIPPSLSYGHQQAWQDGNAHSHLQSTLLGQGLTLPVANGKPVLGTWQQVFHLENDIKARERTVVITVLGT
ncbi:MAG: YjbQ family protein [Candidatus Hydrogenedentes bacterium]|nr:YjbQ family protein [Candidatus Hydrogenedentota bacterium]